VTKLLSYKGTYRETASLKMRAVHLQLPVYDTANIEFKNIFSDSPKEKELEGEGVSAGGAEVRGG